MAFTITEKATREVQSIIREQQADGAAPEKVYLRMRVVGGGCSGCENKLDLDFVVHPQRDEIFEVDGLSVVVDKRSLLYLNEAVVDFHDELNRRGFSITTPNVMSTCGGCSSAHGH